MVWSLTLDFKYILAHIFPGALPAYMFISQIFTIKQISIWNDSTWVPFLFFCIVFGISIDTFRHGIERLFDWFLSWARIKKKWGNVHMFPQVIDYYRIKDIKGDKKFDYLVEIKEHRSIKFRVLYPSFSPYPKSACRDRNMFSLNIKINHIRNLNLMVSFPRTRSFLRGKFSPKAFAK